MALEALFASLKIDDVPAVVEAVKKDGAETSGLAANITALVAKCDSADETEALAAFKTVTQLSIECPQAQAFTKDCLSACKCISCACCILSPMTKKHGPTKRPHCFVMAAYIVPASCGGYIFRVIRSTNLRDSPRESRVFCHFNLYIHHTNSFCDLYFSLHRLTSITS